MHPKDPREYAPSPWTEPGAEQPERPTEHQSTDLGDLEAAARCVRNALHEFDEIVARKPQDAPPFSWRERMRADLANLHDRVLQLVEIQRRAG